MNRQLILFKKKNETVPRAYAEAALRMFPTCIGFAVQDTEDGKPTGNPFIEIERSPKAITLDQFMKVNEQAKDMNVVFTLGNITGDFNKEKDVQPFSFRTPEGQDILAVSVEGDFPDFVQKGHSDEFNLWADYLHPLMLKEYETSDDLGSFYEKIAAPMFKRQLMGSVGHRASCVMLPIIGEPIAHEKNDLVVEYPWGACSQGTEIDRTFIEKEIKPKVEEAPPVVEQKKQGRYSGILNNEPGAAAPATATSTKPTVVHNTPKPEVPATATMIKDGFVTVKPPEKLQGSALNYWYRTFMPDGGLPPHSKNRPEILIPIALKTYAEKKVETKEHCKTLQSEVKAFLGVHDTAVQMQQAHEEIDKAPVSASQQVKPDKQPEEKTTSGKVKNGEGAQPSDWLPIIPSKEKSQELVLDLVTRDYEKLKLPTPLLLQKSEEKFKPFSEEMGIKFEDMFRWSIKDLKALGKLDSDALAVAFVEMRSKMRPHVTLENIIPANAEPAAPVHAEPVSPAPKKAEPEPAAEAGNDPMAFLKRPLRKKAA